MIQFPVRIELKDRSSDRSCSFTIFERFLSCPVKGDHIIIPAMPENFVNSIGHNYFVVAGKFHFCCEEPSLLVAFAPYYVTKYDDMLRLLDWFKGQYKISDFKADSEPTSYYSFYRSVIRLFEWDLSENPEDTVMMKIFSASVSSVLISEHFISSDLPISDDEYARVYSENSANIEVLLNIVLKRKQSDDPIDLLSIIKEWESLINPTSILRWEASEERCLDAARFIFKRLKSIPIGMLPDKLR